MKTNITAKNMVVTPGISNRIFKKTATMERYLKPDTEMFVRLRKERDERICEITVPMKDVTLRAESSSKDNLFMSIDSALAKLERQILRHRTKLEKRLREDAYKEETPEFIEDITAYGPSDRKIVRTKEFPVRPRWKTRSCKWNCWATPSSSSSILKPSAPMCFICARTATLA